MATIQNEILINAPVEKIWEVLATPELLDEYDPTVQKSTLTSNEKTNVGASRRVDMKDGKNWFEEKITIFNPNSALSYELTACSFPVHKLKHSYSFQKVGAQTRVIQVMEYTVKFGMFGKILDALIIRKQTEAGIEMFFGGLKSYLETTK